MLKKKLYSVSFWLLLFISLVVVETISTFAQDAGITRFVEGRERRDNPITAALCLRPGTYPVILRIHLFVLFDKHKN
ncbi:MAG: hypothetical protein ABI791_12265, partial [Acidobacteriota bacterium]